MLGLGSASWADLRYFLQTRLKRCLRNECAFPAIPMKTYMHAATDADAVILLTPRPTPKPQMLTLRPQLILNSAD